MFREMRRKRQLLPQELSEKILETGKTGVLAVTGDEGYPYTVPLNFVYREGAIYFHCAKAGHKMDAIRGDGKVSFCVIEKDDIVPEEFTAYFRSVVAFGRASELPDGEEKLAAIRLLNRKYAPDFYEKGEAEITQKLAATCLVKIDVEHLTGKEASELVKRRGS